MIKAAFFDVDGTLLSFETHRMPASTKRALIALREAGILCFVATGRPRYQFPPCIAGGFEGFSGFDGFVSMTGSLCFDGGGVFFDCPIDPADVKTIVGQVDAGLYDAMVMEADRAYCNRLSPEILEISRMAGVGYEADDLHKALGARIYQFCAFVEPACEHLVTDVTTSVMTTRWNDLFCDVVPKASSKPRGIQATLEHHGLTLDEAIAFGDGGNDESMLRACGIGVAMGNARPGTKAVADFVCDDVDHDGIYNACVHYGLIGPCA